MMPTDDPLQTAKDHHRAGRLQAAEALYRQVVAKTPDRAEAVVLLATLLMQSNRVDEATTVFRDDVRRKPGDADALLALATLLEARGALDESAELFARAATVVPERAAAHAGLGRIERARGRRAAAVDRFRRAATLAPQAGDLRNDLGRALLDAGNPAEAVTQLGAATQLDPHRAEAPYNLGIALTALGRLDEAVASYRRAIAIRPDFAEAWNNVGGVSKTLMRLDDAEAAWRASLRFRPDAAAVVGNLAGICEWQGRHDDAVSLHRQAIALDPGSAVLHGNLLFTLLFHPGAGPVALRAEHDEWDRRHARPPMRAAPHANDRLPDRKLRVGYVCGQFRDHVLGRYLMPLLRAHDRDAIEVVCYSNNRGDDAVTDSFRALATAWRDIATLSDDAAAAMIRRDAIDVLVDTTLHMDGNRLAVFARRPAPVQVTFAGYPGSTGMQAIDWRLTDVHLDPPGEHDDRYAERSWHLPSTFWCYDPLGEQVPVSAPPSMSHGFVTFGCLNNFSKINDRVLALWAAVLDRVSGSRLTLLSPQGSHRARTVAALGRLGVAAERIAFVDHRSRGDYLALYHDIDIALDTVPYNGHTTSLDALWMGVPVVTLVGATVVGRAGVSQLSNLGLDELVARTPEDYATIAATLANDPVRLATLRRTLRSRMERSPLMDAAAFARAIEAAYRGMWTRWCDGSAAEIDQDPTGRSDLSRKKP